MRTDRLARQIAAWVNKAAGEDVASVDHSFVSESAYVMVNAPERFFRVRVARHEPRPTYWALRPTDYEVGAEVARDGRVIHYHQESDGDWLDAVVWVCKAAGWPIPTRVNSMIRARSNALARARAAAEAKKAEEERFQAELARAREERRERFAREHPQEAAAAEAAYREYESLHGKRRKRFREAWADRFIRAGIFFSEEDERAAREAAERGALQEAQ